MVSEYPQNALEMACYWDRQNVVRLLVNAIPPSFISSVLHRLAEKSNLQWGRAAYCLCIQALLEREANPIDRLGANFTAVWLMVDNRNFDAVSTTINYYRHNFLRRNGCETINLVSSIVCDYLGSGSDLTGFMNTPQGILHGNDRTGAASSDMLLGQAVLNWAEDTCLEEVALIGSGVSVEANRKRIDEIEFPSKRIVRLLLDNGADPILCRVPIVQLDVEGSTLNISLVMFIKNFCSRFLNFMGKSIPENQRETEDPIYSVYPTQPLFMLKFQRLLISSLPAYDEISLAYTSEVRLPPYNRPLPTYI